MSSNNDAPFRQRRGRSQRRAVAQVDRRDSAGRGFQHRRQLSPPIFGSVPGAITITQIRTLSQSSLQSTTTSRRSTIKTSITTTTSQSSSSSTDPSSIPTTTLSELPPPVISNPVSIPTASPTGSSADSNPTSAVGGPGGLSSGAIAGIAIAVVVILAALIAFLVRRRMVTSRVEKRSNWLDRSGFAAPAPPVMAQTNFTFQAPPPPLAREPYGYGTPRLSYSQPVPPPSPPQNDPYPRPPPPPPVSFTTLSRPPSLIPGNRSTESPVPSPVAFQTGAVPPPPVAPPSVPPANALTVRCTFVPSMSDELSITTGETIQVLQEYDDGWALCLNARGNQGMVPMECLEVDSGSAVAVGSSERPGLHRSSSLKSF